MPGGYDATGPKLPVGPSDFFKAALPKTAIHMAQHSRRRGDTYAEVAADCCGAQEMYGA